MTNPVFLVPEMRVGSGPLQALADAAAPGVFLLLEGSEARHAQKVQRLREGEELDLVDGRGMRASVVVRSRRDEPMRVEVTGVTVEEPSLPRLVLVQALAKGGRDEQAVEAATEVGVDTVVPWAASRSVVRWEGKKAEVARERWQRVAAAAAKQARRSTVPSVEQMETSSELSATVGRITDGGGVVLICHESASAPYSQVVAGLLKDVPSVAVIVGPEGGITDEELEALTDAGGRIVQLGSTVMRTSTAGPAALVALNLSLGRW